MRSGNELSDLRHTPRSWGTRICRHLKGSAAVILEFHRHLIRRSDMRKGTAAGVICFAVSLAGVATEKIQPLNAKTGLWQTTQTVKLTGLPPQMAAAINPTVTYKGCVKPEDLGTAAWANGGSRLKCSSWTVLKSTGTDMEVQGDGCELGYGMTASGHGSFHLQESEHLTGSIDYAVTGNGQALQGHASYTSKWIGAACSVEAK